MEIKSNMESILNKILSSGEKIPRKIFQYLWECEKGTVDEIIEHVWKKRKNERVERFEKRKGTLRKHIEYINERLNKKFQGQYGIEYQKKEKIYVFLKEEKEVNALVEKKREREKRLAGKTVKVKAPRKGLIPVITSEALSKIEKLKKGKC